MEPERRFTLADLADTSASALDALGIAARNGQVRDRPDARTIRYYTALGLVDRPTEMTGRTARYGDRHLLQVLAVKALQARGASLADVQRALVGATADELRRAIGPGLPAALAAAARPATEPDRAFWRTPPAAAPPATPPLAAASEAAPSAAAQSATPPLAAASEAAPSAAAPSAAVPLAARRGPALLASAGPARARPRSAQPRFARPGSARAGFAQPESAHSESAQPEPAAPATAAAAQDPPWPPRRLVAVPLAAGATLLIEDSGAGVSDTGAFGTGDVDAEALRAAAAPLLAYLTAAGLLPGPPT
jgi:DNA-binding transcriptional MerR regulator